MNPYNQYSRIAAHKMQALVIVVLFTLVAESASAQPITLAAPYPDNFGSFGEVMTPLRSIDGDPIPDVVIAAPGEFNEGRVYIFSGRTGALLRTIPPPYGGARFGAALGTIKDLDGDGFDEILIGDPGFSASGHPVGAGRAYIVSGSSGGIIATLTPRVEQTNGGFGLSVASVPDIDGDGIDDVIVGALNHPEPSPNGSGCVYLFSGRTHRLIGSITSPNEQSYGLFGSCVAGIGDLDGDGRGDVVIATDSEDANGAYGHFYVFSGRTQKLIYHIPGPQFFAIVGWSVSVMPDLDGDGKMEIALGMPGACGGPGCNPEGMVYIISGGTGSVIRTITDPERRAGSGFGGSVAALVDADGDGIADLLVGSAPSMDFRIGLNESHTYVFSGADGSLLATLASPEWKVGSTFGESVSALGDINGDGLAEVVVGAPWDPCDPYAFNGQGRAYILGIDCNGNGIPDAREVLTGIAPDCDGDFIPDKCDVDCNHNGIPDLCDIRDGTSLDCNQNAVPDECDIASGFSQDCNTNGIPDDCELDCNWNHIADDCDIASGQSRDCNGNGIPDECEYDCHNDGIPDDCALAWGARRDCNLNGHPDDCDIQSYVSRDDNHNGIPDECEADCNGDHVSDFTQIHPQGAVVMSTIATPGTEPGNIDLADVNGDGRPDLLISDRASRMVSIFLNRGDGQFDHALDLHTRPDPRDVVGIDFDGDGRTDVAVICFQDSVVSVYFNRGMRSLDFTEPIDFPVGYGPISLVAGDLNDDKYPDLAVVNMWSESVTLLLNSGTGILIPSGEIYPSWRPVHATLADFDGNGTLDIAVSNSGSDDVSILLNRGNAEFEPAVNYPVSQWPLGIAAGDLNHDGKPDLAVATAWGGSVSILTNLGSGIFSLKTDYPIAPYPYIHWYDSEPDSVAIVDIDRDGDLDIAVTASEAVPLTILWNKGHGQFENLANYGYDRLYRSLKAADLDGDGRVDFVNSNEYYPRVGVYLNRFTPAPLADCDHNHVPDICELAQHDCNANGILDACEIANGSAADCNKNGIPDDCEIALSDCNHSGFPDDCDLQSTIQIDATQRIGLTVYPYFCVAADFNGDSIGDMVTLAYDDWYASYVVILLGLGHGQFDVSDPVPLPFFASRINDADLDGDNRPDLVIASVDDDETTHFFVYRNRGDGTFEQAREYLAPFGVYSMVLTDVTGDGLPDLIFPNGDGNQIWVMAGAGNCEFRPPVIFPLEISPGLLAEGDVNGDGLTDLVITGSNSLTSILNLGSSNGTWQGFSKPITETTDAIVSAPSSITLGDLNCDGKADAVLIDETYSILTLQGDGSGHWMLTGNYYVGIYPRSPTLVDLDRDGDLDLAVTIFGLPWYDYTIGTEVVFLINSGTGTLGFENRVHVGWGPTAIAKLDTNGDGQPDFLVTDQISGDIFELRNQSLPPRSVDRNHNGIPDECETAGPPILSSPKPILAHPTAKPEASARMAN